MKSLLMFILFWAPFLNAKEISLKKVGEQVIVTVSEIPLPKPYLDKAMGSGLTTHIFARIIVYEKDQELFQVNHAYKAFFDLWDEIYFIKDKSGAVEETLKFKDKDKVIDSFKSLSFTAQSNQLPAAIETLKISFQIAIDPLSKDKIEKIRKWLALNTVNSPSSAPTLVASSGGSSQPTASIPNNGVSSGGVFRGLMESIFESELKEGSSAGGWSYKIERSIRLEAKDAN